MNSTGGSGCGGRWCSCFRQPSTDNGPAMGSVRTLAVGDCAHGGHRLPSRLMNLEDNLGDVISKARAAAGVPAEAGAAAAGLTLAEYSNLEETGRFARRPNFADLAAKL